MELLLSSFAPASGFESYLKSIDSSLEILRFELVLVLQQIQNMAPCNLMGLDKKYWIRYKNYCLEHAAQQK